MVKIPIFIAHQKTRAATSPRLRKLRRQHHPAQCPNRRAFSADHGGEKVLKYQKSETEQSRLIGASQLSPPAAWPLESRQFHQSQCVGHLFSGKLVLRVRRYK